MWRDAGKRQEAARAMRITAPDLIEFGIVDEVVSEPEGGAQNDHLAGAAMLDAVLVRHLNELRKLSPAELVEDRYQKFRYMTQFFEEK
jgi:acetyl-CoA carboxylase carboxyl transferase subunit alpha